MEIDAIELARYVHYRTRVLDGYRAAWLERPPETAELRVAAAVCQQLTSRFLFLARGLELELAAAAIGSWRGEHE